MGVAPIRTRFAGGRLTVWLTCHVSSSIPRILFYPCIYLCPNPTIIAPHPG
jgi:hypothetical protein